MSLLRMTPRLAVRLPVKIEVNINKNAPRALAAGNQRACYITYLIRVQIYFNQGSELMIVAPHSLIKENTLNSVTLYTWIFLKKKENIMRSY